MNKILGVFIVATHLSCGATNGITNKSENDSEIPSSGKNKNQDNGPIFQCDAVSAAAWFYSADRRECYYATWALCGNEGPSKPEGQTYIDEKTCKDQNGLHD